ncbi:ATP-binding protein [Nitrosomonas sp. JL21]|uniref:ATP-binding protein n=1 Tax=Nitrosomonas sp. JL21 TaxID=153949 RepID=UPI0013708D61|nr:ATP-binding protein [Nitrosomonas sp. JL21]MBL8496789.1 ATP-binding protein [Nitrosomonas sp.]MBL8498459.1 ATP-binding protein [Nitrosomonas sp.]MXS78137.1 ATP-binding protein [Nitrosomonas sp. JL21]
MEYKYTAKSIKDAGFENLFNEITECGNRPWNEINKEKRIRIKGEKYPIFPHPEHPDYAILDFSHFYEFLKFKVGYQFVAFKKVMDNPNQRWGTFYRGQHRVIGSFKVQMAFCTAAQFLEIELILLIAEFLKDCEIKKIRLFSHTLYQEAINGFLLEAPQLVKQLKSESAQIFTHDALKQQNGQKASTKQNEIDFTSNVEKSLIQASDKHIFQTIETNGFCISKDITDGVYNIEHGQGEKHLAIPQTQFYGIHEIAKLLDWQQHLSPFIGRKDELESLRQWLESELSPKSIMLLYGEGGVGKTRLAFHFVKQVQAQGWGAGRTTTENFVGNWHSGQKGLLLVIDYIEERTDAVVGLLRAVRNFDESSNSGKKLRILLLSRNPHFIKTIAAKASIKHIEKILLKKLHEEESWNIFEGSWKRLEELKIKHQSPSINRQPSLPERFDFLEWQERDPMHKVPIFVVALAIYLFNENCNTNKPIFKLRSGEIIRYLSEREERLIRNEVEKYNKDNFASDIMEVEGVLLLKAVATVTNGLDSHQINALTKRLDINRINYFPPKVSGLSRLSLWVDNKIQALQPDILASDFLAYSLEKWAKPHEGHWILAAAGEPDTESAK